MYLVHGVFENQTIGLAIICEFLYFGLDVEGGAFSQRRAHDEPIFFDVYFGAPGRRHVQGLRQIFQFLFFI
jgi:hypothetical protein